MAVDLADLIDPLKREVSTPGNEEATYPNATEDSWVGYLQDGFWEIYLDGFAQGFKVADGIVTNRTAGGDDMAGEMQQLVVLYAGIRIIRNELRQLNTSFRAKAGPVEYETQQSAQVLKGVLDELTARRNTILKRLANLDATDTYYIDAVIERDYAINTGLTTFVL